MPTSTAVGCPEKVGKMTDKKQTKETKALPTILTGNATLTQEDIFWAVIQRSGTDYSRLLSAANFKQFIETLDDILPYWEKVETKAIIDEQPGLRSHCECMLLMIRSAIAEQSSKADIELPPLPSDYHELKHWVVTVKKRTASKETRKPKESISADSRLMSALLGIITSNKNCEDKHPERPSIAYIAKLAKVSPKAPHKPTCANFLLNYKRAYPKPPKKGSKHTWGDGNRQDLSTYDPEPNY